MKKVILSTLSLAVLVFGMGSCKKQNPMDGLINNALELKSSNSIPRFNNFDELDERINELSLMSDEERIAFEEQQ